MVAERPNLIRRNVDMFAVSLLNGGSIEAALKLGVACGAANAIGHLPGRFEQKMVEELLAQVDIKRVV